MSSKNDSITVRNRNFFKNNNVKVSYYVVFRVEVFDHCDCLHCLAEAHLIGENAVATIVPWIETHTKKVLKKQSPFIFFKKIRLTNKIAANRRLRADMDAIDCRPCTHDRPVCFF